MVRLTHVPFDTDAMGHGVTSALIATLGMASLRNSRRAGNSLAEQADEASGW